MGGNVTSDDVNSPERQLDRKFVAEDSQMNETTRQYNRAFRDLDNDHMWTNPGHNTPRGAQPGEVPQARGGGPDSR